MHTQYLLHNHTPQYIFCWPYFRHGKRNTHASNGCVNVCCLAKIYANFYPVLVDKCGFLCFCAILVLFKVIQVVDIFFVNFLIPFLYVNLFLLKTMAVQKKNCGSGCRHKPFLMKLHQMAKFSLQQNCRNIQPIIKFWYPLRFRMPLTIAK